MPHYNASTLCYHISIDRAFCDIIEVMLLPIDNWDLGGFRETCIDQCTAMIGKNRWLVQS